MTNAERARRFRQARTELNLNGEETLAQVYAATGISASALSELENPASARNPGARILSGLAEHYGVNAAWLAGQSDSWSLNNDYRAVTDLLGLSPRAVDKLRVLMSDEVKRDAINSLIESREFDRLIQSIGVLSDYTGKAPAAEKTGSVDYNQAIRKFSGDEDRISFTMAEGDMRSYLEWKVSQDMDALIRRMTGGDQNGKH